MKESLTSALAWTAAAGPLGQAAFVGLYVLATVAFLPGSALTLGAGAAFGLWKGFVLVSIGSTAGACSAFLVGRYLLRDWVSKKLEAAPSFAAVAGAVGTEGWKVVLLTRLSPVLPFNLLNYAYGLTTVGFVEYALASWVGMIPGTLLYVYLGAAAGEAARGGSRARTPAEWAFYAGGLAATAVAAWLVGRSAKRALAGRTVRGALLVVFLASGADAATTVSRIEVEGARTRREAILALLDTRTGESFDPAAWERDLRRLRNLDFFYDVEGEASESDGKTALRLRLRNKHSTLPIFKFKRGGGSSLLTGGLYEINFLDRLLEVGGQYERLNGRPGYALWFRHPYFLSRRNRLGTELLSHMIDLPLLTDKGAEEAFFSNQETRWNGRLQRELAEHLRIGAELSVYRNDFTRDDATPAMAAANDRFLRSRALRSGRTVSVTPSVTVGRLDRDRHFVTGHEGFAQAELAHRALGSDFAFAKGLMGATGGWRPAERWNLVYQARLGSKTGREFQHKFYLGGLDTARGFLDRQFRGEHMWLANLEARPTLVDRPLWVLQGALFTDLAKTWDARNFGTEGFGDPIFSYGIGARVIFPRVYRAILRLDMARTERPIKQIGVSLGLQQFF